VLPLQPPDRGYRRRDLNQVVPSWQELADRYKKETQRTRLPVILTVVHRPLRARPTPGTTEDDTYWLQQLVTNTREAGVLLRIEERPIAAFTLASGDPIDARPTNVGTLGGVLDDENGSASYGITCSHVAQKHDPLYDKNRNQIGVCLADTNRVPLGDNLVCDPVVLRAPTPSPGNGPDVNMLDCALIKLNSTVQRPTIGGVAKALSPGQTVLMTGTTTGKTKHWLGSLCLSYIIGTGTHTFCFRDTIEMVPQPRGLFCGAAAPVGGDSGAWLLTDNQPPDWAGVCIGSDGKRGFAVRSTWVHEWAERVTATTLKT
jgi:hypothetical protein